MNLTFFGADRAVTGSCHCLDACGKRILIDCGLQQGRDEVEENALPFAPGEVDLVLATHAHIDHTGRMPLLYKNGYTGPIVTTRLTGQLMSIMLLDSAHIQESDAQWTNQKGKRAGRPPVEPLYTVDDAQNALAHLECHDYHQRFTLCPGVEAEFVDAGHLLGSAMIRLWVTENGETRRLVFSGDIGNIKQPIIRDPSYITEADYVITESTYGDREHDEREGEYTDQLAEILDRTFARGGNVIIPAFAVGRTQELLYFIREIKQKGQVSSFPNFPVYVDSPLAKAATTIFDGDLTGYLDEEAMALVKNDVRMLTFPDLRLTETTEESRTLNDDKTPKVIISASGMCDAGRIRHHLKHNLWMAENIILIAGYQSKGTLGRALLDGVKEVRLFGEDIAVNAEIAVLHGTSGHADQKGLLNWVEAFEKKPETIFVNHGDTEACEAFQALLQEKGYVAVAPFSGAEFDLVSGKFLAFPEGCPIAKRGAARKKGVFDALIAAAQRLLLVAQSCKERPNRDLTRFTAQIQALIDRWEK